MMNARVVRLAHSPDSDDAFMFYALAAGRVSSPRYRFEHILEDIETLNKWAMEARCEVTAVSLHAYAYIRDKYLLLPHGASAGRGYGPRILARGPMTLREIQNCTVGVPGTLTTAYLVLKIMMPHARCEAMPFDRIIPAIIEGSIHAGLVIHEGQLSYPDAGLHLVADLGKWWEDETGLPLPLGCNVIQKDIGAAALQEIPALIRDSIDFALSHREEALNYAMGFSRGLTRAQVDRFVGMYVNEDTLYYGDDLRRAVDELFKRGYECGMLNERVKAVYLE